MNQHTPVVLAATRTTIGSFQGKLANYTSPQLGSTAIRQVLQQLKLNPDQIKTLEAEVLMGCVLQAGLGQAPARQAAILAGLGHHVPATTINKVCGSGMQSTIFAIQSILSGASHLFIAGGMESMSNAPYLLEKVRRGLRMGHAHLKDSLFLDGLEDAYETHEKSKLMGFFGEQTAEKYHISRSMQDEFALHSLEKAQNAHRNGWLQAELTVFPELSQDELPSQAKPEKIPLLKPAFKEQGTITAANASALSDGASALVLSSFETAQKMGLQPLAKILGHASHAQEPAWFTTAPIGAIEKLSRQLNLSLDQFDLFEINEAFAVVTLAAVQALNLPTERVNVHGGACALGHPIGASGNRILVTLLNALRQKQLKRGIASICIGGGEALAVAIELC